MFDSPVPAFGQSEIEKGGFGTNYVNGFQLRSVHFKLLYFMCLLNNIMNRHSVCANRFQNCSGTILLITFFSNVKTLGMMP